MIDYDLKDSGERQAFSTGSLRDTSKGKLRPDLISKEFIKALAIHLEKGTHKYGERNWEKGQSLERFQQSLERHLLQAFMGDTDENHFAAAAYNLMGIMDHLARADELPDELFDTDWSREYLKTLYNKSESNATAPSNDDTDHAATILRRIVVNRVDRA